jgi:RimJ/RimL family protein N-acetyltransferase
MVKLRKLTIQDAEYMKEYFDDLEIKNVFRFKGVYDYKKTIEFITSSLVESNDYHFAVDFNGEYSGTISLKNTDFKNKNAEYAIVIRRKFWGTDIALNATKEIIRFGFTVLNLSKIYLNVKSSNLRAIKFYKKIGFQYEGTFVKHLYDNDRFDNLEWYAIFNNTFENN